MDEAFAFLGGSAEGMGQARFASIASELIGGCSLVVAGQPHRLREIEFYYQDEHHDDPFAHGDPVQRTSGRWYFHREGDSYRGGSFKGLDITFGPEGPFGGILIRTIEAPDGTVINGCSLCVDHLLSQTEKPDVATLDGQIGERRVWDTSSPLHLARIEPPEGREIVATARVGLTLKMMFRNPEMPRYIMARYRFLDEPSIKKGKIHTVIALHQRGLDPAGIRARTRSPGKTIERYLTAYREGLTLEDFKGFRGRSLKTEDLCKLHGAWQTAFGSA